MNSLTIKSYAKINLFLDILGIREDGYHQLDMINAKISLHDIIDIALLNSPEIVLTLSDPTIPSDEKNTAYRAASQFFQAAKINQKGVKIEIEKKIPHGAGLGGGSSNAGYVLKALNQLFEQPLSDDLLIQIGKSIGADVPFFLIDGLARVGGIGEELKQIKVVSKADKPPLWIVLCSPDVHVSTKEAFKLWDQSDDKKHRSAALLEDILNQKRWSEVHSHLFNSFEVVIYPEFTKIYQTFQDFYSMSPTQPLLSGSGSNIFSLHTKKYEAEGICERLLRKGHKAQVCHIVF